MYFRKCRTTPYRAGSRPADGGGGRCRSGRRGDGAAGVRRGVRWPGGGSSRCSGVGHLHPGKPGVRHGLGGGDAFARVEGQQAGEQVLAHGVVGQGRNQLRRAGAREGREREGRQTDSKACKMLYRTTKQTNSAGRWRTEANTIQWLCCYAVSCCIPHPYAAQRRLTFPICCGGWHCMSFAATAPSGPTMASTAEWQGVPSLENMSGGFARGKDKRKCNGSRKHIRGGVPATGRGVGPGQRTQRSGRLREQPQSNQVGCSSRPHPSACPSRCPPRRVAPR